MSDGWTTGSWGDSDAGDGGRGRAIGARIGAAGLLLLLLTLVTLHRLTWPDAVPSMAVDPAEWLDPAAVDGARGFRRGLWALAALGAIVTPLALVAAAAAGGRWRAPLVALVGGRVLPAGALTGALLAAVVVLAGLPIGLARFAWARDHGVAVASPWDWLVDWLIGAGLALVAGALCGAVLAVLLVRLPRVWPAVVAALAALLAVVWVALAPLVIAPLFERTEPLRDHRTQVDVAELAGWAGVPVGEVRVSDASARTTAVNARVEGLGDRRRIVLYDTLLDELSPAQVRTVVAHELVHVRERHIAIGTLWAVAVLPALCLLLFAVVAWRTGVGPPGRDAVGCELVVRRLAVIAAAGALLALAAQPVANSLSRAFEREADRGALELTGDANAAGELQQELLRRARNVPDPPAWVVYWFGTHPPASERVAIIRAWWEER